ncbi:zinc finger CCCH domain-containing protein 19 [Gossypium australe]|uniref:Zinc finger CCCH domain-containing protein 19 n=1 Tax=Gossypium australe TaxID=47621 RepID=A0A5B6WM92_9ROSI|nr:zinc finger CCCH domain-containing protein 19 [Gossypium australe]
MDTEEEEPHHVPNVDSSVQLEDTPVSTATVSELENRNSESNFELESVSVLDEAGVSTEVSAEKEEEGEGKGVVGEAGAGEKGGEDLIVGEEKCEMLGGGVEVNDSSSGVGNKEGDGGEDGYMAGGKADVVEDAAGVVVMCKMEDASEIANEILSAGGIEVSVAEHGAVEAGNLVEQKVADDVLERVDIPEEKQVADMAEERGIADAAEVDGATEGVLAKEEETSVAVKVGDSTEQTVVKEETGIMDEREVADVSVKSEMMVEKEGEQSGVMEETGVDDMTEKTEFVEEPVVEGEMGTDMVEESGVLEEKSVLNVTEQTEDLEYVHAAGEIGNDMAEPAEDSVMEEESEKEEDTELGNEVEGVEKEEERAAEMGDTVEAMEAADDTEMPDTTEELEMEAAEETEEVAEETEDTEEDSKASGGKRKRGKKLSTKVPARAPSRKKVEEDVCFICFDGGNLVLCDRRGCPKAYHSACVGRDEAFFQSKGKWNCGEKFAVCYMELAGVGFSEGTGSSIFSFARHTVKVLHAPQIGLMALERTIEDALGRISHLLSHNLLSENSWHLCSNCKKNAHYMCFTCTFSLCKGCIKEAVILCIRGNKGFCESCMNLVMLIEKEQQMHWECATPASEGGGGGGVGYFAAYIFNKAQIDFDDRGSWEYLFKDYWIDLKSRLSITADELAQAKNPWKGAAKQESPIELHGFNDAGGSGSDSSSGNVEVTVSKRRKTRSQSKARAREGDSPSTMAASAEGASADENAEWASKELLEVVMNMRNGDKSVLSRMELSQLILDYIQKYKLRDRRNKSYVICDMRLKNLFGKPRVGHIEMLNLLDPHIFFTKEDSQTDDLQGSVVDAEANQLEADWNSDALTKTGKDKKRKTRKKGDARGLQSNVDDYAAIDMHNISLIYLRRNLVEELLEDTETFHDKVVDSFVRIRISGAGQKQDLYRLVQVVGTSKVAEPYRVGKRTTDFLLDILNLNKTEAISIDIISNQEFTEDECKRLRQSIKCGLINRLTVGDIQEKAMTIQAVRVKDWVESEITRLSHLRDRASDLGRRKEYPLLIISDSALLFSSIIVGCISIKCVEKLQILKTPEELQRRLEEIPEIHVDPNMDPSYESEEEDEDDKKKDNYMRPRGSSFNRRGREPISPRKGGYSSTDSWSGGRNYSSMNRELSRNLSGKGFTSKGDDSIGASEMGNENLWNLGRERETQQPNSWSKPKMALSSEIGTRNTHSVVIQEPSLKVASEISPAPPSVGVTTSVQVNETEKMWHYQDPSGKVQGPFSIVQLRKWSNTGYFPADLKIWKTNETQDDSILLTNALAGKFQKDPPVVDNSLPKAQMALYGNSLGASLKQGIESQVGERSRLDQHRVAWSPQRVLASPGQTDISSSAVRPASSSLEIPKHSRDTWGSDTNLPSPTPNQNPTGGNKGQAFESKWSPTPGQSSGPLPVANPFRGGAVGLQPPTVVSESGSPAAPVVHSHPMVSNESHRRQVNVQASVNLGPDLKNAGVSIQNLVQSLSSNNPPAETHGPGSVSVSRQEAVSVPSMPATGTQRWTNASTQKLEPNPSLAMPAQPAAYSHWNDASQAGQFPGVFQTPGQPNMVPSESWRPAVPVQSNVQLPVPPNLPWGMTVPDNLGSTALRPAPGNQNPGWGPIPGNQNMGWGAPVPANTNMNWGPSSQGSASVNLNQNWAPPGQRQVPGNANPGWSAPGNTIQGWTPPGQGPTGWVAPGQGAAPGNANPGYPTPSRNSSMWGGGGAGAGAGAEPNHNGDKFSDQRDRSSQGNESGFGGAKPWNRQSSFGSGGGGSSRPPFKGQRIIKILQLIINLINQLSKPKTALSSEIGTRNTHSVVIQEPSLKVALEISPAPPSIGVTTSVQVNETEKMWHYQDPSGKVQGPFSMVQLRKWSNTGCFPADLKIWRTNETQDDSILLTNALAGKFQKDPPVVDNSLPKAQMALYGNSLGASLKQGIESQVGERSRLDQHRVAWSPQRVLASPGQTDISSSAVRPASSSLEIPKHSRDTWGSDTNLPSPTPNQNPTGGNKGQAFESKWSPTPGQSSGPLPVANPFRGGAVGLQPPTVVSESGSPAAPVVHSHPMVSNESHRRQVNIQASVNLGADLKNAGVSIQILVQSLSSNNPPAETHGPGSVSVSRQEAVSVPSMPATGTQRWTNASTQKLEPNPSLAMPAQPAAYSHWNEASQAGQFPGVFQTPGQPNMVPSESWRPAVPVQSNVQLPAPPNLPWGMTVPDNLGATALRQAPGNQNPGWGPIPGNQNMGLGAPVPANTNMNWGPSSQGSASVNPNQNWAPPGQRQVPGNANPGWSAPGNTIQGWTPPGQGPTGWVAPGQGAAPGNANPGYPTPSRNSSMWGGAGAGAEPNHNGDKFSDQRDRSSQGNESGFGGAKPWNRQS